ncbi:MAG TPA: branched-chain amino acid ABC transporter ATP-binding protein/permease [Stellaceae bacterium]|nr:branched-chain amino acid ABC transporter ATP-binding protein/permease [Stellaceae bacterium]
MEYLLHIAVMVALYAILAASFNLLIGFAGLFALSQAAFFGIGAYATAILAAKLGLAFPLPIVLAVLLTTAVGMLVALPALRIGGDHLVIVTLALQIIVIAVMVNWRSVTGGTDGIAGIPKIALLGVPLDTPGRFLPLALAGAALSLAVAWRLAASPFARAVRAMRENEQAAQAAGKNVVALKLTVFAFSAGLAAVAGGLYAHYISFVSAETFTLDLTIYILAMVILGGTGNLWGSVLGAALLTSLPELLKFIDLPPDIADKSRQVVYGLALIAILLLRPQGLLGEIPARRRTVPAAPGGGGGALAAPAPADGAVTVMGQGLARRFGGILAVSGLDIELRRGRITGLIGPNGAGKTTAFNLLTGFLEPDEGSVRLAGATLKGLRPHEIVRRGMARSFQDLKLFARMTVRDNVMVALPRQKGDNLLHVYFTPWTVAAEERENRARARAILDFVGLAGKEEEVAESLSYAEEKLLAIARLIATGAEVLLFDEPLSGLAPDTLEAIFPIVKRLAAAGKTICIIEHNLDVIRGLCDTAVFLDEGRKLSEDAPERLIADPALAARYFG